MRRGNTITTILIAFAAVLLLFMSIIPFILLGTFLGPRIDKPTGIIIGSVGDGCITPLLPKILDESKFAAAIDEYINKKSKSSPINNLGKDFVSAGIQYGINPAWVVNIARKESSFGTRIPANSNNSYGRTATDSQPNVEVNGRKWYKYESFQQSIYGQSEYLKRRYIDQGLVTFKAITEVYAPPSENDTAGYIRQMEEWVGEVLSLAGDGLSCNSTSSAIKGPPGSNQGKCVNVREISKDIPAKNNRLAHTTLVSKLDELWKKNKTWRVTEACPPSSPHQDANHFNGRAVDIAINPPNSASIAKIDQLQRDIDSIGFNDVIDEYRTNTKFKTGGHFHLEWHGE